ncbi:hypothetical protein [Sandaracinus amylolyticus]|uniref:hypothetical protein n=1 Tax=Sandaracinus amylolyticus TaxID=927083 RepID=UPI001F3DDEA7|nr:hypothetical protein [Sandaracinus amylolyticus]UJR85280.1 Hypothetical protein I5071_73600 [Sandaracinus amylolyticus]
MRPLLVLALLGVGCVEPDGSYACGPVGAYLFCAPDEACVGVISFTGAAPEVWACAPDVGCDAPEDDYCDERATSARCEPTRADANDGSRPLVSVVRCEVP